MEKTRDWNALSPEDRRAIMEMADNLFIPPQYVATMWEQGLLDY